MREETDLIIHNAKIYTVDNSFSIAKAMAIKDGIIIEIGAEQEILSKYTAQQVIDAKTRTVFPGFIDPHCHFLGYGQSLQQVNLVGTTSFEEVVERVVIYSKTVAEGAWITGRGWDQNDWEIKEFPNKTDLDRLFPNTPILIRRIDGHAALANQEALNRANITSETKVGGGYIEVENDELTGILLDNAYGLVSTVIPVFSDEMNQNALLDAQKNCFKMGLTTVDDAGLDKNIIDLIQKMHSDGSLKMKIYAMLNPTEENFEHFSSHGQLKTERLNVRSFKFYADGALGSRGACLLQPYSDDTSNTGLLLNEASYFQEKAPQMLEMNFQMNTHCIGDSANRMILDIYGKHLQGPNDKRWRIEHCQVVSKEDFEKFKMFSIIPSVQATHATSDMYWAEDRLGHERVKGAYAYKQLMKQNGFIVNGSDFPIESINPLYGFYAAVARQDAKEQPEGGYQMENSLTRVEALKAMTIWAAMANFEENEKGSLELGKAADFVILEHDIMEVPLNAIQNIKVLKTFINGEEVYAAPGM